MDSKVRKGRGSKKGMERECKLAREGLEKERVRFGERERERERGKLAIEVGSRGDASWGSSSGREDDRLRRVLVSPFFFKGKVSVGVSGLEWWVEVGVWPM